MTQTFMFTENAPSIFSLSFPIPGSCFAICFAAVAPACPVGTPSSLSLEHFMHLVSSLSSRVVPESERISIVDKMFGLSYVLKLEPTVFRFTERLAADYHGAYWQFNALSNGGFYMAPRSETLFAVSCENGFEGQLSPDALGITACLYAYSHLSFGDGEFARRCGQHYHLLRDWAMAHVEAKAILRAID
jgi:hypothetical protein